VGLAHDSKRLGRTPVADVNAGIRHQLGNLGFASTAKGTSQFAPEHRGLLNPIMAQTDHEGRESATWKNTKTRRAR
jgi:hypothetical protein